MICDYDMVIAGGKKTQLPSSSIDRRCASGLPYLLDSPQWRPKVCAIEALGV